MTLRTQPNPQNRPAPFGWLTPRHGRDGPSSPPNGGRACGFASGKSTRAKHAPNLFFDLTKIRVMKFSTEISQANSRPPAQAEIPLQIPPKVNNFLRPENCKDCTFGPPGTVQTLQNSRVLAS